MNTHEFYVSLETAKLLKQAGFDWEVNTLYQCYPEEEVKFVLDNFVFNYNIHSNVISAPTLEVAQRWLREVKHLDISIHYDPTIKTQPYAYVIYDADEKFNDIHGMISPVTHSDSYGYFYVYEEAQESGIKEALEIILKKGEYENN